ncbi:MAG: ubiquinone/menaquinone biosynthesis methyltransferase [Deferribacteres bacterium]|nr:ubiquinone/menaquinone biosynthesis methyltransferase [candidate division KSB1 bacterium]MCB9503681.1 ubiquinone/menaquinone biosynthesis methyltransferase [Deferribacteres bacterium]
MTDKNIAQFENPQEKSHYVRTMFDRISAKYDLMNRLMTFGQDVRWRKLAIAATGLSKGGKLLDLGCGTGDLSFDALKVEPQLVVAADFSTEMVRIGQQKKNGALNPIFTAADGMALPFADNAFDAAVTGFVMRNVTNIDKFIQEMVRVVRPQGKVVILEITPFNKPLLKPFYRFYFHSIVPLLGGLVAGDREAYTYLPKSVDIFISADELQSRMQQAGMSSVNYRLLNMGTVALHTGTVA